MNRETIDKKIGKVVGYVIHEGQAIDFTPIYTFALIKSLQPGDLIEWDKARKELIYQGNNTNAA